MRSTTNTKKYFTTMKKYCILPIFPPHVRKIKEGNSIIEKNSIFTSTIEKMSIFTEVVSLLLKGLSILLYKSIYRDNW